MPRRSILSPAERDSLLGVTTPNVKNRTLRH